METYTEPRTKLGEQEGHVKSIPLQEQEFIRQVGDGRAISDHFATSLPASQVLIEQNENRGRELPTGIFVP